MLRLILPALVLLGGCTMTAAEAERAAADDARTQAKLDSRLSGFVAGKPMDCIDASRANVEIFGDTLVYRDTSRRLYVTKTTGGCFGLKRDDIIVTRSFNARMCRGDIVRTVDRAGGFPSGACSFGDFIPYSRERG